MKSHGSKASVNALSSERTLRFSRHADERLRQRNIQLTDAMLADLVTTVKSLTAKGCRSALVMIGQIALVVSVAKGVVVTVIGQEALKEQVVTNIDSVAFVSV